MLPIIIKGEARDELLYSQFLCMEHEILMRCLLGFKDLINFKDQSTLCIP